TSDVTLVISRTLQNSQTDDSTSDPIFNFDLGALSTSIEKQLEEVRQSVSLETGDSVLLKSDRALLSGLAPAAEPIEGQSAPMPQSVREDENGPIQLFGWALEPDGGVGTKQSDPQAPAQLGEREVKARHLH